MSTSTTPMEVIAAPFTIYVAPYGTTSPADASVAPDASWTKLGTNGTKNYSDKGVIVTHDQTLTKWKPAGSTGARKVWRTEESFTVEFELVDLTLEQYGLTLNNATVTTSGNHKSIQLQQGPVVSLFALLARGPSPYNSAYNSQYYVPECFQSDNPAPAFAGQGVPAMLACKFEALEDVSGGFGTFLANIS